jgi:enoyl-CoA hydratase/carnithine racemase
MSNWQGILDEHKTRGSNFDIIRRRHLARLHKTTGRNVIAYYSAWLQKQADGLPTNVDDNDKNGFMNAVYRLDPSKGLDLILHTPGGDAAATESLVSYLRSIFDTDIRAIVPQLAMSAGTMIACACKSIVMGKQSSLGPIDPQIGGLPAHGIVEEFTRAIAAAKANQAVVPIWQPIIARYYPTLVGECEKAIKWANDMVQEWLEGGMFKGQRRAASAAAKVIKELSDHALTKSHSRHLDADKCRKLGLVIEALEDNDELQERVLSIHHCMMQTFAGTPAVKIIENHKGAAFITASPQGLVQISR